jgi:selenide,water dikinase
MAELSQVLRHVHTTAADAAVLVGLESPDDAGVYRVAPDLAIVQTVDFFTPIVDDPYAWGRIAAANALSDVYAMGARPVTALNLVGWPRSLDFELLGRVLEGGSDVCAGAGVTVIGGHSIDDPEPKFGLAVTGTVHPEHIVRTSGARPGAALVLTKPLGMGIITTAIKEQKVAPDVVDTAIEIMSSLNEGARDAMLQIGPQAATDVTGFGLMGHLLEMLSTSLSARIEIDMVPYLNQAVPLAAQGVFPGGSKRNTEAARDRVDAPGVDPSVLAVTFDAQTSGGLLIAVDETKCADLIDALRQHGVMGAARIGSIVEGDGRIEVVA